jgi:ABC-2 type transport system permease protein
MDIPVWYLHPAMGLVGLLLWFAVPFGAALMQFRRGDLG